jgi:hypothetical protein
MRLHRKLVYIGQSKIKCISFTIYLTKPIRELYKKYIIKMRLSSHYLAIEQGRYYNVNRNKHQDCCACHTLCKPIRYIPLRTQHTELFVSFGFFKHISYK